ncbi:flagellar biosynthesis protein FlhB [Chthonobacter rhizosphaerae]|uniref:flagellar biosynthesis protein FlhB n=1 Tax=Chthonobacter rhizosphaerae TaxID=2735553 RepID=UPI0015EE5B93
MAGSEDKDSKTEQPTEKKISDALEKGNIPVSKEAGVVAALVGLVLYLVMVFPAVAPLLVASLTAGFASAAARPLGTGGDAIAALSALVLPLVAVLAPLFAILAVCGLAASMAQNSPRMVAEKIQPELSRISLIAGWERIFGLQGLAEFGITCLKVIAVGIVVVVQLQAEQDRIISTMRTDPGELPELILVIAVRLLSVVTVVTILIMVLDIIRSRMAWRSNLKMSHQEVKDEFKQSEGDPILKARQRSIARDRARRRMMDQVPKATVVIANPTHFSVALRYVQAEGGAPIVLAKGQDLVALRIRAIAEEHGIPIIENVALARSLYRSTEVDQMIPPEFYRAVAEVIYHVHCMKGSDVGRRSVAR